MKVIVVLALLLACVSTVRGDAYLEDWMGSNEALLSNATLLDMSLPGSHDTLTYDLSTTVSDDAEDILPIESWLLHLVKDFGELGTFIRNASVTQGLNITEQLRGGVRFIDFRVAYTSPPSKEIGDKDWYGLHFDETKVKAVEYLQEIATFLKQHPKEAVVIWMSRHGTECNTTYPDTPQSARDGLWQSIETMFEGMLYDVSVSQTNETTYSQMLDRGHRALFYISTTNVTNFTTPTSSGFKYMNGCYIKNFVPYRTVPMTHQLNDMAQIVYNVTHFERRNATLENKFMVASQSGATPINWLTYTALLRYVPGLSDKSTLPKCIASFDNVNMTQCLETLLQVSELTNYYTQQSLEDALATGMDVPSLYIDGIDVNGTIRTGTSLYGPVYPDASQSGPFATTKYAYADTMILFTVRRLCKNATGSVKSLCDSTDAYLQARRTRYPLNRWDDPASGRHANWPWRCSNYNGTYHSATRKCPKYPPGNATAMV